MAYALALDLIMTSCRVRTRIEGADCNVHGYIPERLVDEIEVGNTDADEIGKHYPHTASMKEHT
jgi:hypothetical protein